MQTRVTSLLAPCDYQIGGISKIILIDLEDFKGLKFSGDNLYDTCNIEAITYIGTPFEINTPDTAKYTSALSGKTTSHTLETFIPTIDADLQAQLLLASKRKYIVIFIGNNSDWYLFGYDNGASLSFNGQTNDGIGSLVTITAVTPYPLFTIAPFTESAPFSNFVWVPAPDYGYTCLLHSGQNLKQYNAMVKVSVPDGIPLNAVNTPSTVDVSNPQTAAIRVGAVVDLPDSYTADKTYEDFEYIEGAATFELSEDCVPPPVYNINLQQVTYGTSTEIMYIFEYSGFEPSGGFQYEYSTDGNTWQAVAGDSSSPQLVVVPNYESVAYQFRIHYPLLGVISNVLSYPIPLLNRIPASSGAAWSLRRLNGTSQYAIRVRRADNQFMQVPFIPGSNDLDINALLTFAGSQTVFVVEMYDQSGNGRNMVQNTTTRQPRIVINGALVTENGKPAMSFDGSNTYLEVPGSEGMFKALHSAKALAVFTGRIGNVDSPTGQYALLDSGGSYDLNNGYYLQALNTQATPRSLYTAIRNGTSAVVSNVSGNSFNAYNRQVIVSDLLDCANPIAANRSALKYNASLDLKANSQLGAVNTNNAAKTFKIGVAHRIGTQLINYLLGNMQEVIIWQSDQVANRSAILQDVNSYFNAY